MTLPGDFNTEAEARLEQLGADEREIELEREAEGEPDTSAENGGLLERIKGTLHISPEVEE